MNKLPTMQQILQEMEVYCDRLLKHAVRSMVHVGVAYCGVEYFIAERYHQRGLECTILGIDIRTCERADATLQEIKERFPGVRVELMIADSRSLTPHEIGGPFDAAFIDGNHKYEMVKNDFMLVRPVTTTMIGFHDVAGPTVLRPGCGGASNFWAEIRPKYKHELFSYSDEAKYGIGIIYVQSERK